MILPPGARRWVVFPIALALLPASAPAEVPQPLADPASIERLAAERDGLRDEVGLAGFEDAGAGAGAGSAPTVDGTAVRASSKLSCDGRTDQRRLLGALVASGGAWAGRTVYLDPACLAGGGIALSGPPDGGVSIALASGTRLACARADQTAFRAVGEPFAPSATGTYTLVGAEPDAVAPRIEGCRIDLGGEAAGSGSITAIDFGATIGAAVVGVSIDEPHRSRALVRIGRRGRVERSTVPRPSKRAAADALVGVEIGIQAAAESRVEDNRLAVGGVGVSVDGAGAWVIRNDFEALEGAPADLIAVRLSGVDSGASGNRIRLRDAPGAQGIRLEEAGQQAVHNLVELSGAGAAGIVVAGVGARVSSNAWLLGGGDDVAGVDVRPTGAGAVLTGNRGSARDTAGRSWHIRYGARQLVVTGGIFSEGAFCIAPDFTTAEGAKTFNVSVSNVRCVGQFVMGLGVPSGAVLDNNYVAWMRAYCDPETAKRNPRRPCDSDVPCGGAKCRDEPGTCTMCRSAHAYGVGFDVQHHDLGPQVQTTHASIRGGLVHSGVRIGRFGFQGIRFADTRPKPSVQTWPVGGIHIGGVLFYGPHMAAGIDLREIGRHTRVGTPLHPVQVVGNFFDIGHKDQRSYAIWGPAHRRAREHVEAWTVLANTMSGVGGRTGWVENLDWSNASFDGNQPAIGLEQPTVVWFPPSDRRIRRGDPVFALELHGEAIVRGAAQAKVPPGAWIGVSLSDRPTAGDSRKLPVAVGGEAECRVSAGGPVRAGEILGVAIGTTAGFERLRPGQRRSAVALTSGPAGGMTRCLVLGAGGGD